MSTGMKDYQVIKNSKRVASHAEDSQFRDVTVTVSELDEINKMLSWYAGTALPDGRLLGKLEVRPEKRANVQPIPDKRIVMLNEKLDLRNKSILEVGCFEGIHTVGLRMFSDNVTAIDIRPVNVVKTLTRLAYHGTYAKVFQMDVERLNNQFGVFDVLFHCGVLYHLIDPAEHIQEISGMCQFLFLDTHVEDAERATQVRTINGQDYWGAYHDEGGWVDPFSGKDKKAFWLKQESLIALLTKAGFNNIEVLQKRDERNGPRISLLASRD